MNETQRGNLRCEYLSSSYVGRDSLWRAMVEKYGKLSPSRRQIDSWLKNEAICIHRTTETPKNGKHSISELQLHARIEDRFKSHPFTISRYTMMKNPISIKCGLCGSSQEVTGHTLFTRTFLCPCKRTRSEALKTPTLRNTRKQFKFSNETDGYLYQFEIRILTSSRLDIGETR